MQYTCYQSKERVYLLFCDWLVSSLLQLEDREKLCVHRVQGISVNV